MYTQRLLLKIMYTYKTVIKDHAHLENVGWLLYNLPEISWETKIASIYVKQTDMADRALSDVEQIVI